MKLVYSFRGQRTPKQQVSTESTQTVSADRSPAAATDRDVLVGS
jgi:hypothetical protein